MEDWASEACLKAPNGRYSDEHFAAVAISGDTIVAGAAQEDSTESLQILTQTPTYP